MICGWLRKGRLLSKAAAGRSPVALGLAFALTASGCGITRYSTYEVPETPTGGESDRGAIVYRDELLAISLGTVMSSDTSNFHLTIAVAAAEGAAAVEDLKIHVTWSEEGNRVTVPASGFDVTKSVCPGERSGNCVDSDVPPGAVVSSDAGAGGRVTTHVTYAGRTDGPELPSDAEDMVVSVSFTLERAGHPTRIVKEVPLRNTRHSYFWLLRDC